MGRDALSLEEIAVLLGESASPAGRSNEAEDLRRRLAPGGQPPDEASAGLATTLLTKRAVTLLDDWPWPRQLAGRLAGAWSELLRTEVTVTVLYVEATTFGGFLLRAHLPSFLVTATAPGGAPILAAEIPLPLVGSALRRMLGGPLDESAAPDQGLTLLEQRLATRLITCLVADSLAITGEKPPRLTLPLAGESDAVAAGEGPTTHASPPAQHPIQSAAKPESASSDAIPLTVHNRLPRVTPTWSRAPAASIQFRVAYGPVAGLLDCCIPWAT